MTKLPAKKPGGSLIEQMMPDRWARQRMAMQIWIGVGVIVLAVLVLARPWIMIGWKISGTRKAMNEIAGEIRAFTARTGHAPGHVPERIGAHLIMEMSFVGGDELTTFDPTQLNPQQSDPFSPGGREAFIYFASQLQDKRWLVASAGPNEKYELRIRDCVAYARLGVSSLAAVTYDPSNGTWSAGDMIVTGP